MTNILNMYESKTLEDSNYILNVFEKLKVSHGFKKHNGFQLIN